jgi:hypothetical protein
MKQQQSGKFRAEIRIRRGAGSRDSAALKKIMLI